MRITPERSVGSVAPALRASPGSAAAVSQVLEHLSRPNVVRVMAADVVEAGFCDPLALAGVGEVLRGETGQLVILLVPDEMLAIAEGLLQAGRVAREEESPTSEDPI